MGGGFGKLGENVLNPVSVPGAGNATAVDIFYNLPTQSGTSHPPLFSLSLFLGKGCFEGAE